MSNRPDDDYLFELRRHVHPGFEEIESAAGCVLRCALPQGGEIVLLADRIERPGNISIRRRGARTMVGAILTYEGSEACGHPDDAVVRTLVENALDFLSGAAAAG
ncbi:MAG: hypothetical protein AB1714_07365 [Acidobacteriota bacterium]